jgi:hypothetical protein
MLIIHGDSTVKSSDMAEIMSMAPKHRMKVMIEEVLKDAAMAERSREALHMLAKSVKDSEIKDILLKSGYIQPKAQRKWLKK